MMALASNEDHSNEHVSSLEGVTETIGSIAQRNDGFSNFIISPLGTCRRGPSRIFTHTRIH
jgi:hypothetical protein